MCTDDVLHMSFFTPVSTASMSSVEMFMNLSLYAVELYSTTRHRYWAGMVRALLRAIRPALLSMSRVSVLRATFDEPYPSWKWPKCRFSSEAIAIGKYSMFPLLGVQRICDVCHLRRVNTLFSDV